MMHIINANEPQPMQTSTHAPTVERLISIVKYNLYRRLDALDQDTQVNGYTI